MTAGLEVLRDGAADDTLVLVHGFAGAPSSWDAVVEGAAIEARVLGVTLPGHGENTAPFVGDFDDAIASLLQLGGLPECAHWVGYSMGGRVSLAACVAAPDRFASLTLIGADPGISDAKARSKRRAWEASLCRLLREDGIDAFVDAWQALPIFATQRLPPVPRERLEVQRQVRLNHDPERLAAAMEAMGLSVMPDLWPWLSRLPVPLRVVAGAQDEKYVDIAGRIAALCPKTTSDVLFGGHNPLIEDPQGLARLLLRAQTRYHD